jgi:hypothetical protein
MVVFPRVAEGLLLSFMDGIVGMVVERWQSMVVDTLVVGMLW